LVFGNESKPRTLRALFAKAAQQRRRVLECPDGVERWLQGNSWEDALELQRPAADDALVMLPPAPKVAA
jgi:putative SOS response-associated peptidase YedK